MYNIERKENFLRQFHTSNIVNVRYMFEKFSIIEQQKHKDVCNMNTEELLECISLLSYGTYRRLKNYIYKYYDWCIVNGFAKVNYADPRILTQDMVKEYIGYNITYIYPDEIENILATLAKQYDGLLLTAVFLSLYEGVTPGNLPYLKASDIQDEKLILHDGKQVVISPMLIKVLLTCCQEKEVITHKGKKNFYDGMLPDSIWKLKRKMCYEKRLSSTKRLLVFYMKRINDTLGSSYKMNDITNCGIINYINKEVFNRYHIRFITDLKENGLGSLNLVHYRTVAFEKGIFNFNYFYNKNKLLLEKI